MNSNEPTETENAPSSEVAERSLRREGRPVVKDLRAAALDAARWHTDRAWEQANKALNYGTASQVKKANDRLFLFAKTIQKLGGAVS